LCNFTPAVANRFLNIFKGFFDSEKVAGLILVICAVISITLANSVIGASYLAFFHKHADLSFSFVKLNYTAEQWINDGLMAVFFLLVGLEIKRELIVGELASVRRAAMPIAAAIGGMLCPILIHFALNRGTATVTGFAIPMATDIAFAIGVLALAGSRVPASVKVFLTALAIIDDIGAIAVIAIFYTGTIYYSYLVAAAAIVIVLTVFNKLKIDKAWVYLLPGLGLWYCLLQSGVHPTVSGVLLAFTIPFDKKNDCNISLRLQHFLHKPVAYFIVPAFALANTAIVFPTDIGAQILSRNSLGIICGLYIGKVAGIFSFPYLLVKLKIARLAKDISWKMLTGIGLLGGIGFTMSIFITNLSFNDPQIVASGKLSILAASVLAAISGLTIFLSGKKKKPI
jgi:NhaA family Na+:H+ antiporter